VGSNPSRLTFELDRALDYFKNIQHVTLSCIFPQQHTTRCKTEEFKVMTVSDAITAYTICSKAEQKSTRTIDWVISAVNLFSQFLGETTLESITGNDLRRFIIALQQRQAFSHHPFTKPQNKSLSPESIRSYTRAIKIFFSFL
jgi:hypothetical protein